MEVKGRGQKSGSNVWRAAVDIRGLALPSAARAITLKLGAKNDHYRSGVSLCVSIISGHGQILVISQTWLISF